MATLILQSLGCDVAAINTVQLSNHLGYGRARGSRTTPLEIIEIWAGLNEAGLNNFDILLSGYLPDESFIDSVLRIVRESRQNNRKNSKETLFWLLDPVMGDNGRFYVSETIIPAYKQALPYADLILPNHFEAEILSEVKILDVKTLETALSTLHSRFNVPHVIITSLNLTYPGVDKNSLIIAGSSMKSDKSPRIFIVKVPKIDCLFSGTGDMFSALTLVRFREAVCEIPGLTQVSHWLSLDSVRSIDLPLAKAAENVLASMHEILTISIKCRDEEMNAYYEMVGGVEAANANENASRKHKAALAKAAEVRISRNLPLLKYPMKMFNAIEL
ncbi:putative pyridoxal kinase [Erysiphe necator]|uniref:pyridoxal kinase n=1 Tax=Uncinula necator TaxID=52586 RepID=A0A0B1P1H3_UNCNE|nr:putative pyridoxal kinase [Erysiphe necator]